MLVGIGDRANSSRRLRPRHAVRRPLASRSDILAEVPVLPGKIDRRSVYEPLNADRQMAGLSPCITCRTLPAGWPWGGSIGLRQSRFRIIVFGDVSKHVSNEAINDALEHGAW